MTSVDRLPENSRADFLARLKRIEGQAKGIQKMVEDGRDCVAILDQVASTKAALSALSGEMLEAFAVFCLEHPNDYPTSEQAMKHMVRTIVRNSR